MLNITIWNFYFLNYLADDTFISLRYSLNFSKGYGLVYNVDNAPFEGYSNFLFVILMVVPFLITNDLYFIIYFVKFFGLLFCFGSVILMYLIMIGLKTDKKYRLIPSFIFSIIPNFSYWGISGLETSFYSFFLLLSVLFLIKSNFNQISSGYLLLTLFVLSLIRIDGIIISLSILLLDFFSRLNDKKISKRYLKNIITHFSLPYLLYTIFRISYFNSFFPLPFLAKSGSTNSIFSSIQSNLIIFFYLFPFFILLFIFNEKNTINKKAISYLYIIFLITFGLGFIVKISLGNFRLLIPMMLILLLISIYNFSSFKIDWETIINYKSIKSNLKIRKLIKGIQIFFIVAVFIFYFVSPIYSNVFTTFQNPIEKDTALLTTYGEEGIWLHKYAYENYTLAMSDVGIVPFISGLRIIDIHRNALVNPDIVFNGFNITKILNENISIFILVSTNPYNVSGTLEVDFYQHPNFQSNYERFFAMPYLRSEFYSILYVKIGLPLKDGYQLFPENSIK
jgi:hypothetical protein